MKLLTAVLLGFFFSITLASSSLRVSFNSESGKYHLLTCKWAKKCKKNCTELFLAEVIAKGGIPCKVCKPPRQLEIETEE